ncbi:hypothetical protein DVA67_011270 [Solirubrobacter sp. CPCC 204708]|uniref:Uncharacterized protein n=1 Tax=Solirubrobacter deserti TaxID=2282478 RepID=A0ABT4RHT7_9ACTN|nr:hypothetical protein [Solirubrobacter deserti]MBE2316559.1 hypothetical protein [Solirubrobacter deserti]MDA0138093.1 hypothetical protein [Solirubrobacter deserti]
MKTLRSLVPATAVIALIAPAPALAQTDGSTGIEANVPSVLELIITQPKSASFTTFPKARTYSTSFRVAVTTSDAAARLSLADGEVASGSKKGRLAAGRKLLPLPLEARVGKSPFAPLSTPVEPQLSRWNTAVARAQATVNLRQEIEKKASGNYRKVLLVTLSSDTP